MELAPQKGSDSRGLFMSGSDGIIWAEVPEQSYWYEFSYASYKVQKEFQRKKACFPKQ